MLYNSISNYLVNNCHKMPDSEAYIHKKEKTEKVTLMYVRF